MKTTTIYSVIFGTLGDPYPCKRYFSSLTSALAFRGGEWRGNPLPISVSIEQANRILDDQAAYDAYKN
jgi:hypothetical protein